MSLPKKKIKAKTYAPLKAQREAKLEQAIFATLVGPPTTQ